MAYIEYGKVDEKTEKRLTELLNKNFSSYWRKKRIFDLVVSSLLLIFVLPALLLVALLIIIDDPHAGPIYKQKRVGRHGTEFNMYKFRTMFKDADARKAELMGQNEMDGPTFKMKDDPRITRFGKFLRKTSIDELPQFFNVFLGNMSIVGPRPPLPNEVNQYRDYDKLRLVVTPGITCEWQITDNRNDVPFEQWVEMDLDYIENRTTWGDLKIIFRTPIVMLKGSGR